MSRTNIRRIIALSCAVTVIFAASVSLAQAEDLDTMKQEADAQVTDAQQHVDQSSYNLLQANDRVTQAEAQVADAQAALDSAQANLDQAQQVEAQKTAELDQANQALLQAQAKEAEGQARVDAQHDAIGAYARALVQDSFPLISVATLINSTSTATLSNRVQWTDTVLTTNQVDLDKLRDLQAELEQDRADSQAAQQKADAAQQAATDQVAATQTAKNAAATAHDNLQTALDAQRSAQSDAADALAADQALLADAQAEQSAVNDKIAQAAAQAEADRLAQEEADRLAQEQADQQASQEAQNSQNNTPTTSTGLIWPVAGPITDYYGYRIHPIYGTWLFHDGLDIGAGCGVPVKAVASGKVTDKYYSSGYGYRLFIDHGYVNGQYMVSAYNHMSGYAVSLGDWVSQGQTIGYIGSTGNSTGCHMHFMLWVNGSQTDPLPYLP